MDFESCRPWDYYTAHDRPFAERGRPLRRRFLRESGYERTWSNGFFEIFEPPAPKRAACR